MTLGIANQLDDRKGSTVLVGKPEIHVEKVHEAPQKALSNQVEHQDSYRTYVDEDYVKINEPARTGGSGAISSQNDQDMGHTHEQMKEGRTMLKIQTTIEKATFEGNAEEKDTPEAKATNKQHTKTGDRLTVNVEEDNNDEYKFGPSDWHIADEINEEIKETLAIQQEALHQ